MSLIRQLLLSGAALAAALYLWIAYVPAAQPMLDRLGVLELLGVEMQDASASSGDGGRGFGGSTRVVSAEVEERMIEDRVTAIGDGRAIRSVTVRSEATGLITDLPITAGQPVEAGDLVAQLDDEAEQIALERAKLILEDARVDEDRISQLRGSGAISEVASREAQLTLRTAELAEREAAFDLERRQVLAPISGVVGIVDVEVGERIGSQEPIVTITDRSVILIDFRIPERVVNRVDLGMTVDVSPLGLEDTVLEGEISAVDTVVDRTSRTLRVQARVENTDDRLRAGMAFSVALSFPGETLVSIDPLALQWSSEGAFVWAVRDGKAERVDATIRQRDSDAILVDADLEPGERIVIEGVQTLRPGAEVEMIDDAAAAQAAQLPSTRL
ncbi:efflux RND transporter periplasmic adaptor subunit [Roseivivax sp. THAF30]|uniref:efflux RND transporter periplasmic adaptor subunit n=1 Tax=Roseivivax sp. THAF30 TaxID=2587852 RepID=UPI00126876DC|nr:efflux RND transporter periplasmic adaptor subunit [Roseivivax sp. THAF30]QFT62656.1 Multidrug resistance protein MdtA precursor [Roseivivax sp. THAF30]